MHEAHSADEVHRTAVVRTVLESGIVEPFSSQGSWRWPLGLRKHREGLRHVVRRDRHDREGIWFVLSDGSNIVDMVEDARAAITNEGLAWFEGARHEAVAEHEARVRDGLV